MLIASQPNSRCPSPSSKNMEEQEETRIGPITVPADYAAPRIMQYPELTLSYSHKYPTRILSVTFNRLRQSFVILDASHIVEWSRKDYHVMRSVTFPASERHRYHKIQFLPQYSIYFAMSGRSYPDIAFKVRLIPACSYTITPPCTDP